MASVKQLLNQPAVQVQNLHAAPTQCCGQTPSFRQWHWLKTPLPVTHYQQTAEVSATASGEVQMSTPYPASDKIGMGQAVLTTCGWGNILGTCLWKTGQGDALHSRQKGTESVVGQQYVQPAMLCALGVSVHSQKYSTPYGHLPKVMFVRSASPFTDFTRNAGFWNVLLRTGNLLQAYRPQSSKHAHLLVQQRP